MLPHIIGHEFQRKALKHLLTSRRLPSTMMLAGVPGTGKLLVAKELARSILCERNRPFFSRSEISEPPSRTSLQPTYGGCGSCHDCHVFDASNHPDYHFVESGDRERWNVEQVRELLYSLHLAAFGGHARVVIFNNAESLSLQMSNTLLKILEEPQAFSYFILISSNPSKLPPPLLSRCQIWFFDALTDAQVASVLRERPPPLSGSRDATANALPPEELAVLADGSLQSIEDIEQHLETWQMVKERLEDIARGFVSTASSFASLLAKDKEKLPVILQLMRIYARRRMIEASQEGSSRRETCCRWAIFVQNLIAAEHYLFDRNLAAVPLLTVMFCELAGSRPGQIPISCFTQGPVLLAKVAT